MKQLLTRIITGRDHSLGGALLKPLLLLMSLFYHGVVVLVQGLYRAGILPSYKPSCPVISIGNITVGGVGKTPLVMFVAGLLRSRGTRVAVMARGYMTTGQESDEARMMLEQHKGMMLIVDPDRVAAVKEAERRSIADVFLLDDGFQHWPLKRDLDIVAIDATDPFGNGCLLPRGILREPLAALARADLFILTKTDLGRDNVLHIRRELSRVNRHCAVIETVHAPVAVVDAWDGRRCADMSPLRDRVVAVCGIGSPDSFEAMLRREGAALERLFAFDDHHGYHDADVRGIIAFCRGQGISKIVTTHKDVVKLKAFQEAFQGVSLLVLEIEIKVVHGENELVSRIDRCVHP